MKFSFYEKEKKSLLGKNSIDVYLRFPLLTFFMIFLFVCTKLLETKQKIWKFPIIPRSLEEEEEKIIASESGSGTIVTLADLFDFLSKS